MRYFFLTVILFLLPFLAHSGVYRWVDDQGMVHFSDRPGAAEAAVVEIKPQPVSKPPVAPVNHEQMRQRTLQMLEEDRYAREKAAEDRRQARRDRRAECQKAQRRLAGMRSQGNYYRKNPDGTRHYLSQAEREAETRKAEKAVRHWCGRSASSQQ